MKNVSQKRTKLTIILGKISIRYGKIFAPATRVASSFTST